MAKRQQPAPDRAQLAREDAARRALLPFADEVRTRYYLGCRDRILAHTGVASQYGVRPVARYDGGVDPTTGREHKAVWYDLARQVLDSGVPPAHLVRVTLDRWQGWPRPPAPANLVQPDNVAIALGSLDLAQEEAATALRAQRTVWRVAAGQYAEDRGVAEAEAARRVLRNRRLELSSLFRFCMATAAGDAETAAMFEAGALQHYAYNRAAYDEAWGHLIPDDMKSRAGRLFPNRGSDV